MIAEAINAGTSLLGIGMNMFGQNQQQQNQIALMNQQMNNQMQLNQQGQRIQQENWDYTNYENQVKHMENAGLNVGLMYGMGGGGGQSMGAGGGGGASGGNAPQNNAPQVMAMMQQAGLNQAEIELKKAQADKLKSETPTGGGNTGNMLVENMKQSGIAQWFENIKTEYANTTHGEEDPITVYRNAVYGQQGGINNESVNAKKLNADLFKTEAEKLNLDANALLTNEKAKGYWNELMNETAKADAAGVQAAAQKLSAEWNTGEFTNWKTWTDLATKAVQSAGSLIKGGKNVNVTNPTTTNTTTNY